MSKKKHHGNKYEHLSTPEAQLDFHGEGILTPEEITQRVSQFIQECQQKGFSRVLIITGKGLHSRDGIAVIKPIVQKHLKGLDTVKEIAEARRDRGGEGALEIKLW